MPDNARSKNGGCCAVLSLGGFIGLLVGGTLGYLQRLDEVETHGGAYVLGGVIFDAQFGLVIGAFLGWVISMTIRNRKP